MALAEGTSVMHTGKLTEKSNHILTQISIIEQMLPISKIVITDVTKQMDFNGRTEYEVNKIEVTGVAYKTDSKWDGDKNKKTSIKV